MSETKLGPVIAIVGSDGSGKSTVGNVLLEWLRESRPVAMCHLGKQTGGIGRLLRRTRFGTRVDTAVRKRTKNARKDTGPNAFVALGAYAISMRRVRRFRRMMKIRRTGVTIIADRYPQTVVLDPRADGPHFISAHPKSWVARILARRERAYYDWMASYPPNLVIRLTIDLETAYSRKPDHHLETLTQKVALIGQTSYQGAPIVEIDSRLPLETVLARAKAAVTEALVRADAEAPATTNAEAQAPA
jgi:thymidylate kinase